MIVDVGTSSVGTPSVNDYGDSPPTSTDKADAYLILTFYGNSILTWPFGTAIAEN